MGVIPLPFYAACARHPGADTVWIQPRMPRVRFSFPFLISALMLMCATTARAGAAAPRHVLVLYSYEREFSHYTFASLFRPELSRTSPAPIDFIELSLQSV